MDLSDSRPGVVIVLTDNDTVIVMGVQSSINFARVRFFLPTLE